MSRRLLLVRHGRIDAGRLGRFVGASDPPLDDCGRMQARRLAERVSRWAPDRLFCSPMQRCRQTADALRGGLTIEIDDQLREIDFGRWENHTFEEVSREDPPLVERWAAMADDFAFPGGESLQAFGQRVRTAADRLVQEDAETVLAVAHGGVIRTMLCYLLGLEPRQYVAFDVGYAAMAVIELFDGRGVLSGLEHAEIAEVGRG